jgi:hypothetical protein
MAFIDSFLKGVNEQAGTAENTPRSLDGPNPDDPNKTVPYGSLGKFADKIDTSAQRSYVESGYIRNVKPRFFEPLLQEPDMTIVIKKKMFSSLINNYQFDLLDSAERNFIKSSKRLFQNKCQAISIYEKLTKLERIATQNDGEFNDLLMPLINSGIDALQGFGINWVKPKDKAALDSINKWQAFSNPELFTTWMVTPSAPYTSTFGEGTGAFELTLAATVQTTTSTQFGAGTVNLTIEDPYKLMNITNEDIDHAISDAFNVKQTSQLFQFSENELAKQSLDVLQKLNKSRAERGAPKVKIETNNASVLNKRVRAFIDQSGREIIFNFNPGAFGVGAGVDIDPGAFEGTDGLSQDEGNKLSTIIKNTFLILNLKKQKESELDDVLNEDNRKDIQYIREKMRLQFGNKNIIQVMDSVHVYMSSKTTVDNKAIGIDGSSLHNTGSNLLTMMNSTINKLEQSFNNLQGFFGGTRSADSFVEAEKDAIMGPDFPTWLWVSMRNDFTRQAAGVHVAAGIVTNVNSNYSGGKYTVNVACQDNSYYFRLGEINLAPGAAPIDREIFDPLTPFDLDFDASSGFLIGETPKLLPENQTLITSGAVKFKNGSRFLNSPISNFLYGVGDAERKSETTPKNYQKIFFDPDGFVYRWKSGIGTFTFDGPKHPPSFEREKTSPRLTANPFAGQDVMNVLSLLITGQPYNYNNFINSAVQNGSLAFNLEEGGAGSRNDLNNVDVAISFFRNIIGDLQQNNLAWGNFIPFKKLVVSEQGLRFLLLGQFNITKTNADLDRALETRAKIFDSLTLVSSEFAANPNVNQFSIGGDPIIPEVLGEATLPEIPDASSSALDRLKLEDKKIYELENQLFKAYNQANTADGTLQIFGNDFSLSENINEGTNNEEQRQKQREDFRRRLKFLTLRRLWKVKSNEDPNLLIVDDQYDKDYDIQAFERALAGKMGLFKSEYSNVYDQISQVSDILGLEVFADTQGHIQIKPPGYNKIPSSVFERLIRDRKRLFPKALETLFVNQVDGLIQALEIVEDEIRLRGAAIGLVNDTDLEKFLRGSKDSPGQGTYLFRFVSSEDFGHVGENPGSFRSLVEQDNPDLQESKEFRALKSIETKISGQIKMQGTFDKSAQLKNSIFNKDRFKVTDVSDKYDQIARRLSQRKNIQSPSLQQLFSNDRRGSNRYRSQGDLLKITRDIASFISERQGLLKSLRNAIRNIDQGITLNEDPKAQRAVLFNSPQGKSTFPSVIAHMIEDENEDDLGPGSGGRFIIKENQIISITVSEKPPDFSVVEVNGLFGEGFIQSLPGGLETGRGGNAVVSATGVDYDLWRMYGFKVSQARSVPFLSNPDTQCAPLATWMLSEQRRNLITADVTIAGNEFMQPGEVVYIEDRDLLFYIESVSHSYTWGSAFTTSLKLTYGHNPGEYFPTMLDVVGKGLYSKRYNANLTRNVRDDVADGSQHIGCVVANYAGTARIGKDPESNLVEGAFADQNRKALTNLLLTVVGANVPGSNFEPKVELRCYYNSNKGFSRLQFLNSMSETIISWLKNPTKQQIGGSGPGDSLKKNPLTTAVGSLFGKKDSQSQMPDASIAEGLRPSDIDKIVSIEWVDLSSASEKRGPSGVAWLASRNSLGTPSPFAASDEENEESGILPSARIVSNKKEDITQQTKKEQPNNPYRISAEETSLYSNVIDIWVRFEAIPSVDETTRVDVAGQLSQAQQESEQAIADAKDIVSGN